MRKRDPGPCFIASNRADRAPKEVRRPYPRNRCFSDLFREQVACTPQSIAVECRGERLTYEQLRARVDQLARYLAARGVGPGVLVAVCTTRSIDTIVSIAAILHAGGAYVPVDPTYPPSRIRFVLDDARASLLLTERALLPLTDGVTTQRVALDAERELIAREDASPFKSAARPEEVAYVIYTSGSTGRPKGVQITNRNLVNFLWSMRDEPGIERSDVVLGITTICFDISTFELFLPLTVGARTVILDAESAADARLLAAAMRESNATIVQATPATWRLLLASGWPGDPRLRIISGGEALPRQLADSLLERCHSLWNGYGPTETTVYSTLHRVVRGGSGAVPIGRPIANTWIRLLDEERRPVAAGAKGEIYIGGDGVALGYLNRPELTAERFVADPLERGSRLYGTGDVARQLPDGSFVFLGRADHQVKIRGYRIEPEEVEAAVRAHPGVSHAVVVAVNDPSGEERLACHYVTNDGEPIAIAVLRRFLKERLPEYMVPSVFAHQPALPLTPNGKIDRRALPDTSASHVERVVVAPRDDVERELTAIWERALGVAPVGITDNFFDLGGHSLLAMRVFAEIARRFGRELPLSTLVDAPTIERLAPHVRDDAAAGGWAALVSIQPGGHRRPLFVVHGGGGTVLFLRDLGQQFGPDRPVYGLQCDGFDGRPATRRSVEQMAAAYVAAIKSVQPAGPYLLAGYCFGGIVAFEMAQQLCRAGDRAALVALLNAPNRAVPAGTIEARTRRVRRRARLQRRWRQISSLPRKRWAGHLVHSVRDAIGWRRTAALERWAEIRHRVRGAWSEVYAATGRTIPRQLRDAYVFRVTTRAEERYRPARYPGHLVIFRGNGLFRDRDLGWGPYAASIEAVEVGGPQRLRRDIVREPAVRSLARELRARIDRVDQPAA